MTFLIRYLRTLTFHYFYFLLYSHQTLQPPCWWACIGCCISIMCRLGVFFHSGNFVTAFTRRCARPPGGARHTVNVLAHCQLHLGNFTAPFPPPFFKLIRLETGEDIHIQGVDVAGRRVVSRSDSVTPDSQLIRILRPPNWPSNSIHPTAASLMAVALAFSLW